MCLTETLDEMVSSGTLSPELAIQVLVQFDKVVLRLEFSMLYTSVTFILRFLFYLFFLWVCEFLVYDGSSGNPSEEQGLHQGKLILFELPLYMYILKK